MVELAFFLGFLSGLYLGYGPVFVYRFKGTKWADLAVFLVNIIAVVFAFMPWVLLQFVFGSKEEMTEPVQYAWAIGALGTAFIIAVIHRDKMK